MKMPRRLVTWFEIAMAGIILGCVLAIVVLLVQPAKAQDCVDEATNMRLIVEIAQRGIERFGCDTENAVVARWVPSEDPDGDDWFELNIWGNGQLHMINRTYKLVFTDSLTTWWPAGVDTLWARVRALDPDGASAWSDTSDAFVFNQGEPYDALSVPALRD